MTRTKVFSFALNSTVEIDRIIGHARGSEKGPTLIFIGGVHGNEPAGVFALHRVFTQLDTSKLKGNIYGIAGNLWALKHGERYQKQDLNRLWTTERLINLPKNGEPAMHQDEAEQVEINKVFQDILQKEDGPFYFFDMHTTSSETLPFLTVNDSLLNRNFTVKYPLPIILGIEEYLEGPVLSYINELGYIAFGFEAGQHDEMASIQNCLSFIYLSLFFTGCLEKDDIDFHKYYNSLAKASMDVRCFYEIYFQYRIKHGESFKMLPGFYNFQRIKKNQPLANSNGKVIRAVRNGRILMPLYQAKGSDGFFAIKKIWPLFLKASAFFRKYRLDRLLVLLPGVNWIDNEKSGLLVNKNIARFIAKDFFHLLGYRTAKVNRRFLRMYSRESCARYPDYKGAFWY
ncbi:MAG: succinylglutamate desuccinylase/aspartoacylase family protein [Bacteroidota bacterium]